ncbi:Thioredoxin domain-containing protein 17 [Bulinus truncatus]|nr:Thioredoxin domain-containing protein 17 [Bulinus truncatus]
MVRQITVHGYEALSKALSGLQGTVYILFSGSADDSGVSWCPDCVKADPVINRNLDKAPEDSSFIHCYVGDRSYWKKPDNEFRKDPKLLVKCVPTLLKYGSPQRLEEEQLFKDDLIQMLFEEDN